MKLTTFRLNQLAAVIKARHEGVYDAALWLTTMDPCAPEVADVLLAASKMVVCVDDTGINRGVYRHLDNGNVEVDGDHWYALNAAYEALAAKLERAAI